MIPNSLIIEKLQEFSVNLKWQTQLLLQSSSFKSRA